MISEPASKTREDGYGVEDEMMSESVSKTREDGCGDECAWRGRTDIEIGE